MRVRIHNPAFTELQRLRKSTAKVYVGLPMKKKTLRTTSKSQKQTNNLSLVFSILHAVAESSSVIVLFKVKTEKKIIRDHRKNQKTLCTVIKKQSRHDLYKKTKHYHD